MESKFNQYGDRYEIKLIANLIFDSLFLDKIIDIIDIKYFDENEHKWIVSHIKQHYEQYSKPITKESAYVAIKDQRLDKVVRDPILICLEKIFNHNTDLFQDSEIIQLNSLSFCKDQALGNALLESSDLLVSNSPNKYEIARHKIEQALLAGESKNVGVDYDDIQDRLNNKPRKNIQPLPWDALNKRIGGGLGDKEFMLILAPMGAGKTTLASNIACYNRMQGINTFLASVESEREKIRETIDIILLNESRYTIGAPESYIHRIKDVIASLPAGYLSIEKYPSTNTTANTFRKQIKMLRAKGIIIERLIIDYLDVVDPIDPAHKSKKDWEKFEFISRDLLTLAHEENIGIVGFLQGNTSSMEEEIMTAKSTSGGAKRLHPADLIFGYARPNKLKNENKANWSFIKNRMGKDGIYLPVETDYDKCYINIIDLEGSMDISTPQQDNKPLANIAKKFVSRNSEPSTFEIDNFLSDNYS